MTTSYYIEVDRDKAEEIFRVEHIARKEPARELGSRIK